MSRRYQAEAVARLARNLKAAQRAAAEDAAVRALPGVTLWDDVPTARAAGWCAGDIERAVPAGPALPCWRRALR